MTPPPKNQPGFHGADSSRIPHLGTIDTDIQTVEGQSGTLRWKNAKVAMPILSTNELARNGHKLEYEEDHGYIINKKTGHRTNFIAAAGVYFVQLLVRNDVAAKIEPPFGRPGP